MPRIVLFDDRQKTLHAAFQNSQRKEMRGAAQVAVEWSADPEGIVELAPAKDGRSCTVIPLQAGSVDITASAEDEQGTTDDVVHVEVRERGAVRLRIDAGTEDEPLPGNRLQERNRRLAKRREKEAASASEAEEQQEANSEEDAAQGTTEEEQQQPRRRGGYRGRKRSVR